jgi:Secretion system C-terminal sorting domain/Fibronectin type III domain
LNAEHCTDSTFAVNFKSHSFIFNSTSMSIKNYFFVFLFCVIGSSSFAQNILLQQNFDSIPQGGLPTNWMASAANMTSIGWYADSSNFSAGYTGASGFKNAVIKNTLNSTGTYALISRPFSSIGKSGLTAIWGSRVSSNYTSSGSTTPHLYYSLNGGTTWDTIHYTDNAANSTWALVNGGTPIAFPAATDNQASILLKWQVQIDTAGNGTYRIDDVVIGYTNTTGGCNLPTNLSAASITTSSATISWTAASGASNYNIEYKPTSSSTWMNTTSSTTSLNLSGLTAGTSYDVAVQSDCGSGNTSAFSSTYNFTTLSSTTGINALSNDEKISVYPNPCNDELRIKNYELGITKVEIIDLIGHVMLTKEASATNDLRLTTSNLPSGIYFLKATGSNGLTHTTKFIKE